MHRQLHPAQERAQHRVFLSHMMLEMHSAAAAAVDVTRYAGVLLLTKACYVINLVSNATKMLVVNSLAPLCACLARISAKIGSLPHHSCPNTAASDRDGGVDARTGRDWKGPAVAGTVETRGPLAVSRGTSGLVRRLHSPADRGPLGDPRVSGRGRNATGKLPRIRVTQPVELCPAGVVPWASWPRRRGK